MYFEQQSAGRYVRILPFILMTTDRAQTDQTEEQTNYFRDFQRKLASGEEDISDTEMKREEVKLALEIADIIDELNSMQRLFETQKDVLNSALKLLSEKGNQNAALIDKIWHLINQDVEVYKKQVKRMMDDAKRTKEGVSLTLIIAGESISLDLLLRIASSWISSTCNKRKKRSKRRIIQTNKQRQPENKRMRLKPNQRFYFSSPSLPLFLYGTTSSTQVRHK